MKIAITTGGTGGHIYPALALADQLRDDKKNDVFFIGNDYKMESWIVPDAGYAFYGIHNGGLQGSFMDKAKAVLSQFNAYKQAKKILKETRPDCVVAFGGYVCGPVGTAAHALKIPLILHEQNSIPGKANKMLSHFAEVIITSYPSTVGMFKGKKVICLGNPRASLANRVYESDYEFSRLGLSPDLKTCLIVMGSQGAGTINQHLINLCNHNKPEDFQIIIATGPNNYESFMKQISELPLNIHVTDFVDQLALLSKVNLIVARGGASTAAEITAFGVPSIIIPSPYVANNHQYYNALEMIESKASVLMQEDQISAHVLYSAIDRLIHDDVKLLEMSANALTLAYPNAIDNIIDVIKDVVNG